MIQSNFTGWFKGQLELCSSSEDVVQIALLSSLQRACSSVHIYLPIQVFAVQLSLSWSLAQLVTLFQSLSLHILEVYPIQAAGQGCHKPGQPASLWFSAIDLL